MNEYYMQIAIKQAKKALKYNEVPVGAVIVKNNKIISKAFNKKEKYKDTTKHAEIIAISKACKKLKNWRLEDCEIYVTMEPCMMCSGAIEQSRIKKIIYGVKNENYGCTDKIKNIEIISQICENDCRKMVQTFLKKEDNLLFFLLLKVYNINRIWGEICIKLYTENIDQKILVM